MKNLKDEIGGILEAIIGDMDYVSEYCDGTDSREQAEENRGKLLAFITSLIEQEKERVRKETREQAVREFVKVCHKNEIYGDTGIVTGNFIDSGNSDLECLAEQYLAERKG